MQEAKPLVESPKNPAKTGNAVGGSASVEVTAFQGPLPPPAILEQYNKILPGSADRILCMAERQSEHRREIERSILISHTSNEKLGMWLAFTIAMTAIVGGIVLVVIGKSVTGFASIFVSLATLAGVFVYSRFQEGKELDKRRRNIRQVLEK